MRLGVDAAGRVKGESVGGREGEVFVVLRRNDDLSVATEGVTEPTARVGFVEGYRAVFIAGGAAAALRNGKDKAAVGGRGGRGQIGMVDGVARGERRDDDLHEAVVAERIDQAPI